MNHHYRDIRSLTSAVPTWWDEHAVPRYCAFRPDEVADIYASEALLVEIACQGCDRRFLVAFAFSRLRWGANEDGTPWVKNEEALTPERVRRLHYGDPPNAECCAAGPTMNSIPIRVVEAWARHHDTETRPNPHGPGRVCGAGYFEWRRRPELEIALTEGW